MEQIFKCYLGIFLLLLITTIQAGILSGAGQILNARNHFCDYVNRMEAADGSLNIAQNIIDEGKREGYNISYISTPVVEEEEVYLRSLTMNYQVKIPCLGVIKTEHLERTLN